MARPTDIEARVEAQLARLEALQEPARRRAIDLVIIAIDEALSSPAALALLAPRGTSSSPKPKRKTRP